MKAILRAVGCLALAALCWGCASRHAGPIYRAGDELPPSFLTGPVANVLTNLNGFGAHVTSTLSIQGEPARTLSGDLLGREGRLIFQRSLNIKGKRARQEGGLYYIWDQNQKTGYVLSEALQGFAPVRLDGPAPGVPAVANEGGREEMDGHPCHRSEAVVDLSDGRKARLTLWRADDERHFPIRIDSVQGADQMTLRFSDVRWDYPPAELFRPPEGFTAYASPVALMNELIVRDASLATKYHTGEFEEPQDVRSENYHQQPVVR